MLGRPAATGGIGRLAARSISLRRGNDAGQLDERMVGKRGDDGHGERARAEEDGPRVDRSSARVTRVARAPLRSRLDLVMQVADGDELVHRLEIVDVQLAVQVVQLVL